MLTGIFFPILLQDVYFNRSAIYIHIYSSHLGKIFSLQSRFFAHLVMAYVFTFWTCYVLLKEYEIVASMRLQFLETEKRRPDQFTVSSSWLAIH